MFEICLKLTIVDFEQILHILLVLPFLTLQRYIQAGLFFSYIVFGKNFEKKLRK